MAALRRDFLPPDLRSARWRRRASTRRSRCRRGRRARKRAGCSSSPTVTRSSPAWSAGWISSRPTVDEELERVSRHPRLVGVRHIVQGEPDGFLERPAFRRGIALPRAARADLRHPRLRATAARGGRLRPRVSAAALRPRSPGQAGHPRRRRYVSGGAISAGSPALPNVCCKLSGLVTEADWQSWTPAELRPYLDAALESFGPSRLMIGSDWPVCLVAASYARRHRRWCATRLASTRPTNRSRCSAERRRDLLGASSRYRRKLREFHEKDTREF